MMLHVGLRGECSAETVEVRWNDAAGTVQTFEDLPANYETVLVEGAEQPLWPGWDGATNWTICRLNGLRQERNSADRRPNTESLSFLSLSQKNCV